MISLSPQPNAASLPKYALLTDAPPLKQGGHGCHVLAWQWIEALGNVVKVVVSRRLDRKLSVQRIGADLAMPVVLYPDACLIPLLQRVPWIRSLLEAILFVLWLPRVAGQIQASKADRVFAFFGGDAWFLLKAGLVSRWTRLPLDIYLVDDLETSARLAGRSLLARLTRWGEPRVLRRAARVFTISPGYAEHLRAKYHVEAQWLPVPIAHPEIRQEPYQVACPDVRDLTFIGAVNPLYLDALKDCLKVIQQWNEANPPWQLRLLLMTYSAREYVERELGHSACVEILIQPPTEEFNRRLKKSWALFLPYSFSENVRVMVSTSFPTKVTDSLPSGRPLVVYGPPWASLVRYFRENRLPLCASLLTELAAVLRQVAAYDTVATMDSYEAVLRRYHGPAAIRDVLIVPSTDKSLQRLL
jgi:hypothetical protein